MSTVFFVVVIVFFLEGENPVSVMPVSNHVSLVITYSPDAFIVGLPYNHA